MSAFPFKVGDHVWVKRHWPKPIPGRLEEVSPDGVCCVRPDHAPDMGVAVVTLLDLLTLEEAVAWTLMELKEDI